MPTTGSGGSTNPASETVAGVAEIATQTETNTGTDDARIVTPAKLANYSGLGTPDATETTKGKAELATQAETDAGTDDARIVTPLKLAGRTATATRAGVVELATDTEAQTGTDTARAITPANLAARSATETRTGVVELATDAETQTGTDTARAVTPANLSARTATEARAGIAEIATQAETDAGTDDARGVTPLKLATTPLGMLNISRTEVTVQPASGQTSVTLTSSAFSKMHVCIDRATTPVDYTVNLPAVSGNAGKVIVFRMSPGLTKLVTLDANSTETIDGQLTRLMWAYESVTLECDGTQWISIASASGSRPYGAFSASRNTSQTITAGGITKVQCNTEDWDHNNLYDNATNYRYTAVVPGKYYFTGGAQRASSVAGSNYTTCFLYKNGAGTIYSGSTTLWNASGFSMNSSASAYISLVAGDYIELHVQGESTVLATAYFQGQFFSR